MRRALGLCGLLLVLAAGCGEDEAAGPPPRIDPNLPPPKANASPPPPDVPKLQKVSGDVASSLDQGVVGVVDPFGHVAIRPQSLEVASDATLQHLSWERWDASGAEGEGTMRALDCSPTCAQSGELETQLRIELSAPRLCDGRQYFNRARVESLGGDKLPAEPAIYLRAPC